jgi:DNA-binding NarL/FixJ family response regulator
MADDHTLVRQGIKNLLSENPSLVVIGEAVDGNEVIELVNNTQPNLVLLDIAMPRLNGLRAAYEIRKRYPQVKLLMRTLT